MICMPKTQKNGGFECESITSLSADNYSAIPELWPYFAALLAAAVFATGILWLRAKMGGPIEGAAVFALVVFVWQWLDFVTDINLAVSLFRVWMHSVNRGFNENSNWQWLALAILCALFVALPLCLNLAAAWRLPAAVRIAAANNHWAQHFVRYKSKVLIFGCLFSGNLYATLQLANCRLLPLDAFHMGLTKPQLASFSALKLRYNVCAENIPQLFTQVLVLIKDATDGDGSKISLTLALSFLSSFISVTATVLEAVYHKDAAAVSDDVDFEAKMEVSAKESAIGGSDLKAFKRNRHRFESIGRVLCEHLDISFTQMHIGSVNLTGVNCVVYGQMPRKAIAKAKTTVMNDAVFVRIWNDVLRNASPQCNGSFEFFGEAPLRDEAVDGDLQVLLEFVDDEGIETIEDSQNAQLVTNPMVLAKRKAAEKELLSLCAGNEQRFMSVLSVLGVDSITIAALQRQMDAARDGLQLTAETDTGIEMVPNSAIHLADD